METEEERKNRLRRKFFALGTELGFSAEAIKERAKKFYGEKESFRNLTANQISRLIDKLEVTKLVKEFEKKEGK